MVVCSCPVASGYSIINKLAVDSRAGELERRCLANGEWEDVERVVVDCLQSFRIERVRPRARIVYEHTA